MGSRRSILWLLAFALFTQPVAVVVAVGVAPCCCSPDVAAAIDAMAGCCAGETACVPAVPASSSPSTSDAPGDDAPDDVSDCGCECPMPCCTASGKMVTGLPAAAPATFSPLRGQPRIAARPDAPIDAQSTRLKRPPRLQLPA